MTNPNSVWLPESRTELTSCRPNTDHHLQGLHYRVSQMHCTGYACNNIVTNLLSSNGLYSLLLLFWFSGSVYLVLLSNRLFQLVVQKTCFPSNGFPSVGLSISTSSVHSMITHLKPSIFVFNTLRSDYLII
jgi:hypothetical protein